MPAILRPVTFLALVAPTLITAQQVAPPLLTRSVSSTDWDVPGLDRVRFGQVAIVDGPDGVHVEVRQLRSIEPRLPAPVGLRRTPAVVGNTLLVGDFARNNRTPLGGYFGTFQRAPSVADASVGLVSDGSRALTLSCRHQVPGFCGLWVQLYDFEAPPDERAYLDARSFSTLSLWVRGREGGERVLLKVADMAWEQREDALPVGELSAYLPAGRLDTLWQQAVVPLEHLPRGLRRDLLAMVALEALVPGTTTVELGPIGFSLTPDPSLPRPQPAAPEEPPEGLRKATWVWNTAELLDAPDQSNALLGFLAREGFSDVFLQLPGMPDRPGRPGELAIDVERLRPLVGALNALGLRVYALDGYARYALPEFHEGVLATIDHVARYNGQVSLQERFFGVRYDIEPYLLPEFHGPRRTGLLTGLLELTAASVQRAHAAGLAYGADIPFWYDAPSEESHERVTLRWRAAEKSVGEHIIDVVDDVAIMDYRTTAHGADGTIRHGRGELEYAEIRGKPVFIALETFAVPDEVLLDFRGEPRRGIPGLPARSPVVVMGAALDSLHAAVLGETGSSSTPGALAGWLEDHGLDAGDVWWWPVDRRVEVPATKISFADQDPRLLERVVRATAYEFGRYRSFAGFAIHYAQTYRALLER